MRTKAQCPKTAIVCAWRKGEDDLDATVASAKASAPKTATIYTVEDTTAAGPARTRHRGIEAATDAEVVVIIDAHMRFGGNTIRRIAREAAAGFLVCPTVYHNAECSEIGVPYAGARIVWRSKDGPTHTALAGKWSRDNTAGIRGCVMGGCYAFRRDWYYRAGQPLAMLPGWGGDEEALSIAAWLMDVPIVCTDDSAAHRYRPRPPWSCAPSEFAAVRQSRMALIAAFTSGSDKAELEEWQRRGVPEGVPSVYSPEAQRVRTAMEKAPNTFEQWKKQVCEPDEIEGVQSMPKPKTREETTMRRAPRTENIVTTMHGVRCPHCGRVHDPKALFVTNTYANGNRRHVCRNGCGRPFISHFIATAYKSA